MLRLLVWLSVALCRWLLGLALAIVVFAILGRGPLGRRVLLGLRIMRRIVRL